LPQFKELKEKAFEQWGIQSLDVSVMDSSASGQELEGKKEIKKKWKRQGLGATTDIVENLANHLKFSYEKLLFKENFINQMSVEKPLHIFVSISGDGSKLSKTGENQSSNFISICLQIIFDETIFFSDNGVSLICSLLPWYLISDKEDKESVRKFGKWLSLGGRMLEEIDHIFWTEKGPKTSQECENFKKTTGCDFSRKRKIKFGLLLVKGDSKFMQMVTGQP